MNISHFPQSHLANTNLCIYIYVQPPAKKLKTLVDFLDCSSAEGPNLLGFRQGGRLRSLGLLLFENRLLIKKDLGPILATAACSTTVTIGGNRAARIFGAKKPMWETDENLTDPSKWVGGPNNWLFSAILVGGLRHFFGATLMIMLLDIPVVSGWKKQCDQVPILLLRASQILMVIWAFGSCAISHPND